MANGRERFKRAIEVLIAQGRRHDCPEPGLVEADRGEDDRCGEYASFEQLG